MNEDYDDTFNSYHHGSCDKVKNLGKKYYEFEEIIKNNDLIKLEEVQNIGNQFYNEVLLYFIIKYSKIELLKLSQIHDQDFIFEMALFLNNVDVIKFLVDQDYYLDLENDSFALMQLGVLNCIDVVKYLISIDYDITKDNFVLLSLAAHYGHLELVKILIDKYPDLINIGLEECYNEIEVIKYLLLAGADFNKVKLENKENLKDIANERIMVFVKDFHFKRELELHQSVISDINLIKMIFMF